jgi:hypothetical protein
VTHLVEVSVDNNVITSSGPDFLFLLQPNPHYQFAFDVKDDEFTNYQNRKEQREGGKISGSYSVVDSDGFIRTVKYTADPLEVCSIHSILSGCMTFQMQPFPCYAQDILLRSIGHYGLVSFVI